MENDRELLEYAAKAAGLEATAIVPDGIPHRFGGGYWNPLTDDGDALRLAVKLRLDLIFGDKQVGAIGEIGTPDFVERYGSDKNAATRRAIVRAAAEIGKRMNGT